MKPPVPIERPASNLKDPASSASAGLHDLVERDAVLGQPLGIDLDLDLLEPLAPDRHVRDTGHAQEARADRPVGDHRQVDQRDRPSDDSPIFITRLVAESGCIMNGGARPRWQVGVTVRDPLLDQLASPAGDRCPARRSARSRTGA